MSADTPIRCCIDVRPPTPELPPGVEALAADADWLWPNGSTLRVRFADGDPTAVLRWFACADEWSRHANIGFAVATGHYDLLVTFKGPPGTYYSYLGTQALSIPRGTPTMVLAGLDHRPATEFRRVALHEIGHALGCVHEHQSPAAGIPWDREAVYRWYKANAGWDRAEVDDQVFDRYAGPRTQYTAWDRLSIMEYPIDAALLTDPSYATGWNRELNETDKAFIARLYPGRSRPEAEPKPEPETPTVPEPPPAWATVPAPIASPSGATMSNLIHQARAFCLTHSGLVVAACTALGLYLTGHPNEAIATIGGGLSSGFKGLFGPAK